VYRADYDNLHTQELAPSGTFVVFGSGMRAKTTGIEAWGAWQASERWRISAGYMAEREKLRLKADSNDAFAPLAAGRDPAHGWLVRSAMSLGHDIEWDVTLRGVAALSSPEVPAYRTLDTRLGWKPMPRLEVSLAVTNLADGGHGEFTGIATRTEVGRTVYLGLRWRFDGP
jgi:iron complex outermembrane receptor protein